MYVPMILIYLVVIIILLLYSLAITALLPDRNDSSIDLHRLSYLQ